MTGVDFDPRVAVASLSGQSDAEWAGAAAPFVGAAFLGGIAVDGPTRAAARRMVADRDRTEFLPADPFAFVDRHLAALEAVPLTPAFNVRAVEEDALGRVATICADRDAIVEINAHCRQEEICDAGAGQTLLGEPERLAEQVRIAADAGARVSVKIRTEVSGVDLPALCADLAAAGADILHVDAMDSEAAIAAVVDALAASPERDAAVIANNGVRDRETVREYLDYGADAVSVGRPSDDPAVLERVSEATTEWFAASNTGPAEVEP